MHSNQPGEPLANKYHADAHARLGLQVPGPLEGPLSGDVLNSQTRYPQTSCARCLHFLLSTLALTPLTKLSLALGPPSPLSKPPLASPPLPF